MAGLGHSLVFPLGGEGVTGGKPWIVNMRPAPEEADVGLLRPISFSLRDTESYVNPTSLNIAAGYAKIHGDGAAFFDRVVASTTRRGLLSPLTNLEPILSLIPNPPPGEAVRIKKLSNSSERSTYFTSIPVDNPRAFRSVVVSILIRPVTVSEDALTTGATGPVLGLEMGPRNSAAYAFFKIVSGVKKIMIAGPLVPGVAQTALANVDYDWSTNQRYSLIWNESRGAVHLFAGNNTLIASVNISSFPQFNSTTNPRHGTANDYVAVYGIEGLIDEEVEISGIAITDDVGFPLHGVSRPKSFITYLRAADFVRTTPGVDLRKDLVSPWYDDNAVHFEAPDEAGEIKPSQQYLQFARVTANPLRSVAVYREEPGFLIVNSHGYCVDLRFFGTNTLKDEESAGMGFVISDGFSVFRIGCFQYNSLRYLGILKVGGDDNLITDQYTMVYDWSTPGRVRFLVDGKQNRIQVFAGTDLIDPIFERVLNRSEFPAPIDYGWTSLIPFIGLGHFAATQTTGSFYLQEVDFSHYYQSWEAGDGKIPNDGALSIVWTKTVVGTPINNPANPVVDFITIGCDGNDQLVYHRDADTDAFRGASVEFRVEVSSHEKFERTGDAIVIDDGLKSFVLTFTDSEEGKFACIAVRADLASFQEISGFDGDGPKFSFRIDWEQPHDYRMERRPFEGIYVFIDSDLTPSLFVPESLLPELPDTMYSTPTIAFGHFLTDAPSVAKWSYVRTFFSTGFEISFKKNLPDSTLKRDLFGSEAIILVEATDSDT